MNKQLLLRNLLIVGSGQIGTWLISFATIVISSRYLGPDRMGQFNFANSLAAIMALIAGLGMGPYITRAVAREPERTSALVSAAAIARSALVLPTFGALALYVFLARLDSLTGTLAFILLGASSLTLLGEGLGAAFQGHDRMSLYAVSQLLLNLLDLVLIGAIVLLHGGVIWFALSALVIAATVLLLAVRWIWQIAPLTAHITRRQIRDVVFGSVPFWANSLFLTFYIYVDSVILASMAGDRAVGLYGPPTRIFSVALFAPTIIATVTTPLLSRRGVDAGQDFVRAARKTLSLLIVAAVPITVGLIALAGPAIAVIFGTEFLASVPVLMVLSLCIPCTFLNVNLAATLAARNQQWLWTIIMAASCVVNPLANVVLIHFASIHWHSPTVGAACALLLTEVLMATYGVIVARDITLTPSVGRALMGALAAGLAQAVILRLLGPDWILPGEVLAALCYVGLAIALGAVPISELRLLRDVALRRAPSAAG